MRKDNRPRWSIEKAVFHGKEALRLAQEHRSELEPRFEPGMLDGMASDLNQLEALETGRPAKATEVAGLTGSQGDIAEKGAAWAAAIREVVRKHAPGDGLRKAAGVGSPVKVNSAKSVATAIETILAAARERPAEIRSCGLLDSDIQRGQALLAALSGARSTRDDGMGGKTDMTSLKNAVQLRVERALQSIASLGHLHYLGSDAALAQRFNDLIPGSTGGNGGGDEPPAPVTGNDSAPKPPKAEK